MAAILITSCEKEEFTSEANESTKSSDIKGNNYNYLKSGSPQLELDANGVLKFDSFDELKDYFLWAENTLEEYSNSYLEDFSHLTEQEIADSLHANGFDPELPLDVFEQSFEGYTSLRKRIKIDMAPFLLQDDFNVEGSPEGHLISDPIMRTIVNQDGAYKVGDSIYFPLDSGIVILGPDADYNQVVGIINQGGSFSDFIGPFIRAIRILVSDTDIGCNNKCKTNRNEATQKSSGDKKYYFDLGITYYAGWTSIQAQVRSWKKFPIIGWVPYSYTKYVSFDPVRLYTGPSDNCFDSGEINGKSKSIQGICVITDREWGTAARRVKCDKLKGKGRSSSLQQSSLSIGW